MVHLSEMSAVSKQCIGIMLYVVSVIPVALGRMGELNNELNNQFSLFMIFVLMHEAVG